MAVLMIGGMDSSGGAGLLRDCAVAARFEVPARVAVTAVTAQTDKAVLQADICAPQMVQAQIRAAFQLGPVAAVKIGMLGNAAVVRAVAEALRTELSANASTSVPAVLDPVIESSSGKALLDGAGLGELTQLLPQVDLVTPNLPELARLGQVLGAEDPVAALLQAGAGAVLVKGGHDSGAEAVDRLVTSDQITTFTAPRLPGTRRGTGCTLAAAIACGLAVGQSLPGAVKQAKAHVTSYLRAA
ncbi:hydroxymethylpyrimidine/phosphomethylpyrimidine kinase [Thalassobius sp. MITS945101]|uniref:hydroxymethylpyrimidine/phosphomethylpyrimidine kinase n=1 Tax=Thalassobius sp. MITS945101 TaxID=3096994 RepID=UPI00399AC9BD